MVKIAAVRLYLEPHRGFFSSQACTLPLRQQNAPKTVFLSLSTCPIKNGWNRQDVKDTFSFQTKEQLRHIIAFETNYSDIQSGKWDSCCKMSKLLAKENCTEVASNV